MAGAASEALEADDERAGTPDREEEEEEDELGARPGDRGTGAGDGDRTCVSRGVTLMTGAGGVGGALPEKKSRRLVSASCLG